METIDGLNKLCYSTIMKFMQVNRNNVDKLWRCEKYLRYIVFYSQVIQLSLYICMCVCLHTYHLYKYYVFIFKKL